MVLIITCLPILKRRMEWDNPAISPIGNRGCLYLRADLPQDADRKHQFTFSQILDNVRHQDLLHPSCGQRNVTIHRFARRHPSASYYIRFTKQC